MSLWREFFTKETYNFEELTNQSHPIVGDIRLFDSLYTHRYAAFKRTSLCVGCENIHTTLCSRIHKTFWHPTHTLVSSLQANLASTSAWFVSLRHRNPRLYDDIKFVTYIQLITDQHRIWADKVAQNLVNISITLLMYWDSARRITMRTY